MSKSRFYRLFKGFYEQYFIALLFMALTPTSFYSRPMETVAALLAIFLGTLGDISINRVYDADDDSIEKWKSKTNPVSNGDIDKDFGWKICVAVYFLSIILSLLTGDILFAFLLSIRNLFGFLYSGPPIRAKSTPIIDVVFHLTIIDAGPAFMAMFYMRNFSSMALYMLGFLVLNSMFTQISQEVRDLHIDRKAKLDTTAQRLGLRNVLVLQKTLLIAIGLYVVVIGVYKSMLYITATAVLALAYIIQKISGDSIVVHKTRRNAVVAMLAGMLAQVVATL